MKYHPSTQAIFGDTHKTRETEPEMTEETKDNAVGKWWVILDFNHESGKSDALVFEINNFCSLSSSYRVVVVSWIIKNDSMISDTPPSARTSNMMHGWGGENGRSNAKAQKYEISNSSWSWEGRARSSQVKNY